MEKGEALATWALAEPPDSAGPVAAEALPDHRLAYLEYEGEVSGGRGSVRRWDHGNYRIEAEGVDGLSVVLSGTRLIGRVELRPCSEEPRKWQFSFVPSVSAT